jgi:hypothetical protein
VLTRSEARRRGSVRSIAKQKAATVRNVQRISLASLIDLLRRDPQAVAHAAMLPALCELRDHLNRVLPRHVADSVDHSGAEVVPVLMWKRRTK